MPSQFFGLNTAYSGLMASNAGINTTGNNISNVETKGYSRQQVSQQAYDALRTFTTYGCAGAGVETIAIERMRNEFYDEKYWNNSSNVGEYDVKAYYMKQIENYYRDDKTIEGFTTIFNKMYDSLKELKKDTSQTKREQFVGGAESLLTYFKNMSENMEKLQADANAEIKIKTDEINAIATSIASLNKQISIIEGGGSGKANELRDQRSLLIDQLSLIADVKVSEEPIYDPKNPGIATGNRFRVTIAGGQPLVDSNEYNTIVCVARKSYEKVNQTDTDGLYDLYWARPGEDVDITTAPKFNIYAKNLGGQLKSLVQTRDGNNGENFRGTISGIGETPDGRNDTVTIDVNAAHLKDIKKLNLSDQGGVINLGNQLFYYDSWTYNYDEATDSYSYEFVLSDSTKNGTNTPQIDKVGKDATIGSSIPYQGIPYYMQQMNEWVRSYADAFNSILTDGGVDGVNGDPAKDMFVANDLANGGQFYIEDIPDGTGSVSQSSKSLYRLTAKNIAISQAIADNANYLATRTENNPGDESGEEKTDIVDSLIDLKTNRDKMSFRGASSGEFLECILSDITLSAKNANLFSKNYNSISGSIDIQRQSISGVDNDEEALNLVKYQNAYTLSSKMIQTLTEIYDQLILNTGV